MKPPSPSPVRADVIAGVTTAAVVIPKAMAYAAIAGLPLEAGLYTSLIPLVIYAVLGTSRPLSVTTTSTIAIMSAGALAPLSSTADPAHLLAAASSLALMVGGFLLLAGVLRMGFLADFISAPVLTGFKAGTAILIIEEQVPKLLGIHFEKGSVLQNLIGIAQHLPETSLATVAVAVALMVLVVVLEHWVPHVPAPLVAVALGIAAAMTLGLQARGVELVGAIQSGLPPFALPDPALAYRLWPAALGIALVSFVETIAAGRAFLKSGEPLPIPNRELVALGVANLCGSAFSNMPSGGGTSQTHVNRDAGAATQLSGLVTAVAVLATLLFLSSVVSHIPHAALAAVVVATTVSLLKPSEFQAIWRVRQRECWWAFATVVGVVLFGTLEGVLIAVVLSVLVLFYQANRPPVYVLGRRRSSQVFVEVSDADPDIETVLGLLMMRTEGRIHFANANRVGDQMWSLVREHKPRVVALEMSAVPDLGYTALMALTRAEQALQRAGTTLWLVALSPRVSEVIARAPLGKILGHERIFDTPAHAADAFSEARTGLIARP